MELASLPDEILAQILSKLALQDPPSLLAAACTSKAFYRHVSPADSFLWKEALFGQWPPLDEGSKGWEELNKLVEGFGGYKQLVLARFAKQRKGIESGATQQLNFLLLVRTLGHGRVFLWAGHQDKKDAGTPADLKSTRECNLKPVYKDDDTRKLINVLLAPKSATEWSSSLPSWIPHPRAATAGSWRTIVQLEFYFLQERASPELAYEVCEATLRCRPKYIFDRVFGNPSSFQSGFSDDGVIRGEVSIYPRENFDVVMILESEGSRIGCSNNGSGASGYVRFCPQLC